jgi:hypothetical protein
MAHRSGCSLLTLQESRHPRKRPQTRVSKPMVLSHIGTWETASQGGFRHIEMTICWSVLCLVKVNISTRPRSADRRMATHRKEEHLQAGRRTELYGTGQHWETIQLSARRNMISCPFQLRLGISRTVYIPKRQTPPIHDTPCGHRALSPQVKARHQTVRCNRAL